MASGSGRNFNFKVVLLGEGCVGKTSCVLRYVENKFNDKHLTTLQVIHERKGSYLLKYSVVRLVCFFLKYESIVLS